MVASIQKTSSAKLGEDQMMNQINALKSGQIEGASLTQLAAVQEAAREADAGAEPEAGRSLEVSAALIDAFKKQKPAGEKLKAGILNDAETLRSAYREERPNVLMLLGSLGAASLLVAVLGAFPFGRSAARFFMTMLFSLSSYWMVLVSLSTAAFFWISGFNVWPVLPGEVLGAPIAFMFLCGGFVRLLDPNYPLWNGLLRAFGSPILACLAIFGAGALPAWAAERWSAQK